ncbi:MAG: DUF721 domain-containing protein [Alphaproteobacteria bacterium]
MTASKPPPAKTPGPSFQRKGLRSLAATLPPITAPIFKTRGFAEAGILTDWPAIVGETLGRRTAPERIAFPRGEKRGGTLHVTCESAFAPELQHLAPQVIERINGYFGYPALAQIKILHGRVAPKPAKRREGLGSAPGRGLGVGESAALYKDARDDEADPLAAALARLGAAIKAKGR